MLTNPHTNICGCYELGFKQAARETGIPESKIEGLFNALENDHRVLEYNSETREVLLYNWSKYNWSKSSDFMKGVTTCAGEIKCDEFRDLIFGLIDGEGWAKDKINQVKSSLPSMVDTDKTVHRPSIDRRETSVSVSVTDTVTDSVTVPVSDYTEDFELFWNVYPKKIGKKEAYKAFQKAKKPVQLLINAVKAQMDSEQWTKDNGRYIPNPATWLNQGRWDDAVIKAPKTTNPFLRMLEEDNDETGNSETFSLNIVSI